MPKEIAKLPEQTPVPRTRAGQIFNRKQQAEFNAEGDALAHALGWQGADAALLLGVSVIDCKNYLHKVFHQVHQAVLNEGVKLPSVEDVANHLGLTDKDDLELVAKHLGDAAKREQDEREENLKEAVAISGPHPAGIAAIVKGSASAMTEKFEEASAAERTKRR